MAFFQPDWDAGVGPRSFGMASESVNEHYTAMVIPCSHTGKSALTRLQRAPDQRARKDQVKLVFRLGEEQNQRCSPLSQIDDFDFAMPPHS